MVNKCGVCGKVQTTSDPFRHYCGYFEECGVLVRCFQHSDIITDFGKNHCRKCGTKLTTMKLSENKQGFFCKKCNQSRSGRNVRHIHGKDCQIPNDDEILCGNEKCGWFGSSNELYLDANGKGYCPDCKKLILVPVKKKIPD